MRQAGCHAQTPRTIRKTLGITDRSALGVLGHQLWVVITVDVTAAVTACREVDARRERRVGIELRVLRMRPLNLEVTIRLIIRQTRFTRHIVAVTDIQVAREMVTPYILHVSADGPCAARIDIAGQLQVQIVADSEVVSEAVDI